MSLILCSNVETLARRVNTDNNDLATEAAEMTIESYNEIVEEKLKDFPSVAAETGEWETDKFFENWNGGKYSSEARRYGYYSKGPVAWSVPGEADLASAIFDAIDAKLTEMLTLASQD